MFLFYPFKYWFNLKVNWVVYIVFFLLFCNSAAHLFFTLTHTHTKRKGIYLTQWNGKGVLKALAENITLCWEKELYSTGMKSCKKRKIHRMIEWVIVNCCTMKNTIFQDLRGKWFSLYFFIQQSHVFFLNIKASR